MSKTYITITGTQYYHGKDFLKIREESDELSWGVDRKIFRVSKNGFNIVSFDNFHEDAMFTKRDDFKQSLKIN